MTQYERMVRGLIYDACDEEIMRMQRPFQEKLGAFNQLGPADQDKKQAYLKEVFAECGDSCYIELPFHASWGGAHVHFGTGIYANFNVTLIDDGHIFVGNRVLFGPNVTVATASHPLDPELRRYEMQYNKDVYIGDNVWIGAGATILPGVHIGRNTVIGAGSVVTRDIPENVVALGNPCRVLREIGACDRVFFDHNNRIDVDELVDIIERKKNDPKFQ